jgi:hypothetical protein
MRHAARAFGADCRHQQGCDAMKKLVLVAVAGAVLGLSACSKAEDGNTATANEAALSEEVPADENLSAVDESSIGNTALDNSAEALPADNVSANAAGNAL